MALTSKQCEEFWRIADTDQNGELTIKELQQGVKKYNPNIKDSEVAGMFCCIDRDGDERMTKREFMHEMLEREKRSGEMDKLFKKYDTDKSGSLERKEIIKMVSECFPEDQVFEIVGQFLSYSDLDGSGKVSYEEFRNYFG